MKKITLLIIILITAISSQLNAQEKFTYTEKGLTDYVVLEINSLNQTELYNKTINWVKETYVNPDEVIKAKFENEKIRFDGFKKNAFSFYGNARYSIQISFKDGKLKFEPLKLEEFYKDGVNSIGYWSNIPLDSNSWLLRNNGKIKRMKESHPENIERLFNNLLASLNNYFLTESGVIKDSEKDW